MTVPASYPPLVQNILLWARRLLKSPNTQDISDATLLDYLNRFYLYHVPLRIQQFELKTQYSFETQPNVDRYNLPIQTYQNALTPALCDGLQVVMVQSNDQMNKLFPSVWFNADSDTGNGGASYSFTLAQTPFIRGHTDVLGNVSSGVYITAQSVSGTNLVVKDDGVGGLTGDGTGSVNYLTGAISVNFIASIPSTSTIRTQTISYASGKPTAVLFFNNIFTLRVVPDRPYLMTFDAYLTPSAFLTSGEAVTFSWMGDYLAHGIARMVMKDLGDSEQLQFYEPFFMEQERQVLRRTGRQNSNTRVGTIYQSQITNYSGNYTQF